MSGGCVIHIQSNDSFIHVKNRIQTELKQSSRVIDLFNATGGVIVANDLDLVSTVFKNDMVITAIPRESAPVTVQILESSKFNDLPVISDQSNKRQSYRRPFVY